MKIFITGGAGFVGSHLAKEFKSSGHDVTCFDNLKRRGSEINLARFKELGISFVHGDVRNLNDLMSINQNFDLMIEASAEPSVLAGLDGSPDYLIQTNILGAYHCLEFVRKQVGAIVFLSTSRVYSLQALKDIQLNETSSRFEIAPKQNLNGVSTSGVNEDFPVDTARSLYGASKLAGELLVQEYANSFKVNAVINRCGVIAGAGQFGKVDQGVFTLWVANHFFNKSLKYTGFGGTGKQVRDLLHPTDLYLLINHQIEKIAQLHGDIFCVGGSTDCSTSMLELTGLCQKYVGQSTTITADLTTSTVDIPLYISDNTKARRTFNWKPKKKVEDIVEDIALWMNQNADVLRSIFT